MANETDKKPHVIMADGKWLGGSFKDKQSAEAAANAFKAEDRKHGRKDRDYQVVPKTEIPRADAPKFVFGTRTESNLRTEGELPVETRPLDVASTLDVKPSSETKNLRK